MGKELGCPPYTGRRVKHTALQENGFVGRVPDFRQAGLVVNFSNNRLEGGIPVGLENQNASSFLGNIKLCGKPLGPCKENGSNKNKIACTTAAVAIVAFLLLAILFLRRKRSKPLKYQKSLESARRNGGGVASAGRKSGEYGKLYFVRGDRERFSLDELLKAPAEILGSGSFGSSYKATLSGGRSYVVRRFRQMGNAGKDEFYGHMRRLGRLSHRNLVPVVGFYYRKEDKLLIADFVENGSLASHLHGKRTPNQPGLDWPTRLKIIKGIARGLSYLYNELPHLTLPHGHLKSSNILLDPTYEPLLSDYSLAPLINKDHAHHFMVAHKSPESMQLDLVTRKTDVWSLGILILELLTGRFPANYLKRGRGPSSDLATWVDSVLREDWSGEVFDRGMMGNLGRSNSEGQMVKLLKIGMCCCEWDVEKRWDLREAVERIEELKEIDGVDDDDDDYYFCYYPSDYVC
ncbi:Probable LRR receptor-like serine/threonine-protein kinase [Striga hermonthica]|uniref:Probable LRR receptor-like serine/threonine-protein kinase n=1 Tax=Striga hermonthica TaxID=68872 RepID=A0A9N7N6E7_STRHE|nr:Probable LRR receptor-like serine/threonine-protein kinase [Striga hermonthica]